MIRGISFDISSMETWRPIQVREPSPNYDVLVRSGLDDSWVSKTYRHIITIHGRKPLGICCEPSVGVKESSILTEDICVSVGYPAVDADNSLSAISYAIQFPSDDQLTPSAKNLPQISAPPSGTTLSSGKPVAGCIRSASLITAWR